MKRDTVGHIMSFILGLLLGGVVSLCFVLSYNGPLSMLTSTLIVGGSGLVVGLVFGLVPFNGMDPFSVVNCFIRNWFDWSD